MNRHFLMAATAAIALAVGAPALQAQQTGQTDDPAAATGQAGGMGMQGSGAQGMNRGDNDQGAQDDDRWGHGKRGRGMYGTGMPPGMMLMMFVMLDTDGDKALSLEEVLAVHQRMFGYIDGDDDGKVTQDEMQGFMKQMHRGG